MIDDTASSNRPLFGPVSVYFSFSFLASICLAEKVFSDLRDKSIYVLNVRHNVLRDSLRFGTVIRSSCRSTSFFLVQFIKASTVWQLTAEHFITIINGGGIGVLGMTKQKS